MRAPSEPPRPPLATWIVFPALLVAVFGATHLLLRTDLPRPAASGIPLVTALLVVLALERLFPLHRSWNRRPDGLDLLLLVVNRGVDAALLVGTLAFVSAFAEPLRIAAVWPQGWPLVGQVLLGLTLGESLRYALHRVSHRPGWWWRIHHTHHEPDRMYALIGPRLHPLNYLWVAAAHAVPMLVLGAELPAVLLVMNVTGLFVIVQHANLNLRFDGLNRVLATPDVHRLHHAREAAGRGVNFAIVLVAIDRLFGTYAAAGDPVPAEGIGLVDPQIRAR
jgi:sterol desaturase/sphingolipid hydroxylase (fatty acid hydroxylase superfamily)